MYRASLSSLAITLLTLFSTDTAIHHEFCESYLWHHRIEILNVITSLMMLYFPIKSMMKNDKTRNYLPEEVLITVGIGSALFHYNKTFLTALFDEIPMLIFLLVTVRKTFPKTPSIRLLNTIVFITITTLKLCGMSSFMFSVLYATFAVLFGLLSVASGIMSLQLAVKLILISGFRQTVEDYCLYLPFIISLIGHPLWHILISKFSVELADEVHDKVIVLKKNNSDVFKHILS